MEKSELKKYPPYVVLEENDGKVYYRASFREFPDMIGGIGDTVEEAIDAAYSMLEADIEFREQESLPIPGLIVTPLVTEASGRITLRMSKSLHRQIIEISEEEGISLNSYINEAVSNYVGQRNNKKSRTAIYNLENIMPSFLGWGLKKLDTNIVEEQDIVVKQNSLVKARA